MIQEAIQTQLVVAMRAKDTLRLDVLRAAKTLIKTREVEKRGPLTDGEVVSALTAMVKQRRDSIEQFTAGGRPELAEREAAEIGIIETFLPKELTPEEITARVKTAVAAVQEAEGRALTPRDMGLVMKVLKAGLEKDQVRADGAALSATVRAHIAGDDHAIH